MGARKGWFCQIPTLCRSREGTCLADAVIVESVLSNPSTKSNTATACRRLAVDRMQLDVQAQTNPLPCFNIAVPGRTMTVYKLCRLEIVFPTFLSVKLLEAAARARRDPFEAFTKYGCYHLLDAETCFGFARICLHR